MVIIEIDRKWKKKEYTVGRLYVNGKLLFNSLEDTDRGLDSQMGVYDINTIKIYGKTAIPSGVYDIELTNSPKFAEKSWGKKYGGLVPILKNIKGFTGVRIHPANTAEELLGCIAVGKNTQVGRVTESTKCYCELMDNYLIPAYRRGERISIDIH